MKSAPRPAPTPHAVVLLAPATARNILADLNEFARELDDLLIVRGRVEIMRRRLMAGIAIQGGKA